MHYPERLEVIWILFIDCYAVIYVLALGLFCAIILLIYCTLPIYIHGIASYKTRIFTLIMLEFQMGSVIGFGIFLLNPSSKQISGEVQTVSSILGKLSAVDLIVDCSIGLTPILPASASILDISETCFVELPPTYVQ